MSAYLGSRATENIVNYGLGDWYDIGPKPPGGRQLTPMALTATAFYYQHVEIMARTAALLGKRTTPESESLAGEIRAAFNEKFFQPADRPLRHRFAMRQCHPAGHGTCEPANRPAVLTRLSRTCAASADRRRRRLSLPAPRAGRRRAHRRDLRHQQPVRQTRLRLPTSKARPA